MGRSVAVQPIIDPRVERALATAILLAILTATALLLYFWLRDDTAPAQPAPAATTTTCVTFTNGQGGGYVCG